MDCDQINTKLNFFCPFCSTGCNSTCDIFDQPVRSTKFYQLLVIYDSFCSWMATNLIHNCNFDHNPKGWKWEPRHLKCQNSTILTFYPDLANFTHLNSDFFKSGFAQSSIRKNFSKIWNNEHTQKSHKVSKRNQNSMENQIFWTTLWENVRISKFLLLRCRGCQYTNFWVMIKITIMY